MKKYIFAIAAFAAAVSCSKDTVRTENTIPEAAPKFTFTAVADKIETRAGLAADGKSIEWKVGDKVTTCFENAMLPTHAVWGEASVVSVGDNGVTTFEGALPDSAKTSSMYAIYNNYKEEYQQMTDLHPYIVKNDSPTTRHRVNFSAQQTAVKDGFDSATLPMPGYWSGTEGQTPEIHFKNIVTLLCVELKNQSTEEISSIEIVNTSTNISGIYYWEDAATRGEVYFKSSKDVAKKVILSGTFAAEGKYYAYIPGETTDLAGLSVKFTTKSGKSTTFTNPNALSRERNHIYNIGKFTLTDDDFADITVPFGTAWGESFFTGLEAAFNADKTKAAYVVEKVTVKPSTVGKLAFVSGQAVKNKVTLSFTVKESGTGYVYLTQFYNGATSAKGPAFRVYASDGSTPKSDNFVHNVASKATEKDIVSPDLTVEAGDIVRISMTSTDSFSIYGFEWRKKEAVE